MVPLAIDAHVSFRNDVDDVVRTDAPAAVKLRAGQPPPSPAIQPRTLTGLPVAGVGAGVGVGWEWARVWVSVWARVWVSVRESVSVSEWWCRCPGFDLRGREGVALRLALDLDAQAG